MTTENKKQPLAEQESYALSITNENCYTESSKFFLLIHHSTTSLLDISLDASYPLRDFCRLSQANDKEPDEFYFKNLNRIINRAEEEALKLAKQCAEIRRKLNGKEAQNV